MRSTSATGWRVSMPSAARRMTVWRSRPTRSPVSFLPESVCRSAPAEKARAASNADETDMRTSAVHETVRVAGAESPPPRWALIGASQTPPRPPGGWRAGEPANSLLLAAGQGLEVVLDHLAVARRQVLGQLHHRL